MNTYDLYTYKDIPYFSINIDADTVGFSMIELLINENAKLAKEFLNEGDFESSLEFCKTANKLDKLRAEARRKLSEKEREGEHDESEGSAE